ncbi:MAG TPA: SDR family NAD(P)-dependent oxidoreductase [Nevskiaceae bacterium]|nr:SDR family NAD(P)-dependent oxidoreductase [Nevskiaceae bacterium]
MNQPTRFDLLCLTPAGLGEATLALAARRAGAEGLLDLAHAPADAHPAVRCQWQALCEEAQGRAGLRLTPAQLPLARELLAQAAPAGLRLILAAPDVTALRGLLAALADCPGERWLEVADIDSAEALAGTGDGLVLRAHEAGGWVGEDGGFVLLQKAAARLSCPYLFQGGAALRGAAALRLAGAVGLVLDDALWLLEESPLPAPLRADLARLNGAECKLYGEALGAPCRAWARAGSETLREAERLARTAEAEGWPAARFRAAFDARLGFAGETPLLPLGQAIGLAAVYARQYRRLPELLRAIRRQSRLQGEQAREQRALDAGSALARSHGTPYPLAQGPMTRVSDHPGFAAAVAAGGALPFLALALLPGAQVERLLEQTHAQCGERPWGVGLLGFAPEALRAEQCEAIWRHPPRFALIAGGRPDQAAAFEGRGITTYLHAPAPALLRLYLEQGARRFVFEGRECGGHVGPLASLPLWEAMVELLLSETPAGEEKQIHLLFAGGLHDDLSAALLATLVAPLVARGMKVGVLMGTAYLFTREIVESGAVVPAFQAAALGCTRTVNLESGPGHASRCVVTPFVEDFAATRRRLLAEGLGGEALRDALEALNLGRLRLASKGLERRADGALETVPETRQREAGMYMIGQVATLRDQPTTVLALHEQVCRGAQARLARLAPAPAATAARPSDIAVIGIGTLLPGAESPGAYWSLLCSQRRVLREVPRERWDTALYYDADPKARDKIYSRWGGFLDEIAFDPLRYGIPPASMKSIDPLQLLTLECAARTLADAGYAEGGFDRAQAAVILGAGGGAGDLGQQYAMRAELPRFVEQLSPEVWERLPEWTEESFAGTLLNVAAGRVANRLDFGGVNFTVDAACGSSLAAIHLAVQELESGRSSLVLAGGFDTTQSAFAFTAFAKTQALSPSGAPRAFDESADGIAISEGVVMVALKRLHEAEADGDRIYAVIKATAGSSDGRALGLTAPRVEGQMRALERAYAKAGFSPATLGLVEAHGTGTPVGDRTEAQTIARVLRAAEAAPRSVALGSVKTLLGHTKAAAGAAGLVKTALALHHRCLPPHHGVERPIAPIAEADAPVYLLRQPRPWLADPVIPRRAAVSAFGFGGTNFHAVLEEYRPTQPPAGSGDWPQELFLFSAADRGALEARLRGLLPALARTPVAPAALARALAGSVRADQPLRLAVVAASITELASRLEDWLGGVATPAATTALRFNDQVPAQAPRTALLFPGQGSQYPGMGGELALYVEELHQAYEQADALLLPLLGERLSRRLLPPAAFDEPSEIAQRAALTDTRYAQPAIGAMSLGLLRLLTRLGLSAEACAGHSYGEYSALHAAGVFEAADLLRLSAVRGAAMAEAAGLGEAGTMAAVQAPRAAVEAALLAHPAVRLANHNAPAQCVISGPRAAVEVAVAALEAAGLRASLLPVAGAFHTPLVAAAQAPLAAAITATAFHPPHCAVWSNVTAAPYPQTAEAAQALLDQHLLSRVEFVHELEGLRAAGIELFVEVGPKSVLSGLVRQTLGTEAVRAIALDGPGGGLRGLLLGLAELWCAGAWNQPERLFLGRSQQAADLSRLDEGPPALPAHVWMVSGGCARPLHDPERRTGQRPALTLETREAARAALAPAASPVPDPVMTSAPATPDPLPTNRAGGLSEPAWQAYQQTMQQFLALQERVLQQALGLPSATATAGVPPAPAGSLVLTAAPVTAPAAPQREPVVDRSADRSTDWSREASDARAAAPAPSASGADLRERLLALTAERTGYPAAMLALDADLEADLGVDSIKRVEILGALRKTLPAPASEAMKAQMERYTRARSLGALLELLQGLPTGAAATPARGEVMAKPAVTAAPASLPRYQLRSRPAPLPAGRESLGGLAVVIGADEPVRRALLAGLQSRGLTVVALEPQPAETLRERLAEARAQHPPLQLLLHLAGLETRPAGEWLETPARSEAIVLSLFHALQVLQPDLAGARVLAASRLGGSFGRDAQGRGSLLGGGLCGLLNCLRQEVPGVQARALDFDGQSEGEIARLLVEEAHCRDAEPEAGYIGAQRFGTATVALPLARTSRRLALPAAGEVLLATGGARGITAEILQRLAVPGLQLVLVGRTPEPGPEPAELAGLATPEALRQALLAQRLARGEAPRPVEIERAVQAVLVDRELRRNLGRLRASGAQVDYRVLDVREDAAFGALIDGLYARHGRLDAVIHGAGVIEDRRLADKSAASFARVLGTKLDPAWVLARHLRPESLRLLAFFTSVAGRYGNLGQGDYAAANEVLNRLAWTLHRRWTHTRVMAINWGPWDGGMASPAVREALRSRGMTPIDLEAGCAYFLDEWQYGARAEVELVAGAGPWGETRPATSADPALTTG